MLAKGRNRPSPHMERVLVASAFIFYDNIWYQRQDDRRVNKRQIQTQESKIDTGKAIDDDLVFTESSGIESEVKDDNNMSGNDTDANDADIKPIYDEEPMAEVQLTAEYNIFAIGQQHTEQPEMINEGRVDQYPEQCQVKSPMLDLSPDNQTTDYFKQSLEYENILLKKTVAQFQKDFSRMEAYCIALELKYQNQALKSGQHEENPVLQKLDHVIASSSSRNSSKNMPRVSSNDMVHNHYLDEARKKTQERDRNSKTSVIPSARFQSTADGSKPKPRSNNQTSRSLPCVFNANHDACITKLLKEVNSRAKVPSNKTTNRNKPVEQIRIAKKPERQIPTGHRFSIKKTSAVHEKTMTLRSCLRWKPTGKIFRTVGLRWVPTGKIFTPSTTKVDSEPPNGSNADITNQYESTQTLDVSAGTSNLSAGTSFNPKKEELRVCPITQQQPDSTSSTSTLATSVTADGNFDLLLEVKDVRCLQLIPAKHKLIKKVKSDDSSQGDKQDNDLKNLSQKDKGSKQDHKSMNEHSITNKKQDQNKAKHKLKVISSTSSEGHTLKNEVPAPTLVGQPPRKDPQTGYSMIVSKRKR
ncbi:hypothetical protein Tco_0553594 [Tanacetum coccineum]